MGKHNNLNQRISDLERNLDRLRGMLILSRDVGLTVERAVQRRYNENPLTTHDEHCGLGLPNGECTCGFEGWPINPRLEVNALKRTLKTGAKALRATHNYNAAEQLEAALELTERAATHIGKCYEAIAERQRELRELRATLKG